MTAWVSARRYVTGGMVHPILVNLWNHAEKVRDEPATTGTPMAVKKAARMPQ